MPEIPKHSDLFWLAAMNKSLVDPLPTARIERGGASTTSTERVYGMHPRDYPPTNAADIAQIANEIDDIFAASINPYDIE